MCIDCGTTELIQQILMGLVCMNISWFEINLSDNLRRMGWCHLRFTRLSAGWMRLPSLQSLHTSLSPSQCTSHPPFPLTFQFNTFASNQHKPLHCRIIRFELSRDVVYEGNTFRTRSRFDMQKHAGTGDRTSVQATGEVRGQGPGYAGGEQSRLLAHPLRQQVRLILEALH